jgi:osmotically-inducible protein OsmY
MERHLKEGTSMHAWKPGRTWGAIVMAILLMMSLAPIGCAGTGQRTGEVIDDSVITTKVKSSFVGDSTVSAFDIAVDTSEGVVNLKGIVDTSQQRQRAIEIAQATNGVKAVDARNLVVKR